VLRFHARACQNRGMWFKHANNTSNIIQGVAAMV
jgi:hypothetical protein